MADQCRNFVGRGPFTIQFGLFLFECCLALPFFFCHFAANFLLAGVRVDQGQRLNICERRVCEPGHADAIY